MHRAAVLRHLWQRSWTPANLLTAPRPASYLCFGHRVIARSVATTATTADQRLSRSDHPDAFTGTATLPSRREAIRNAKPFSDFLTDTFNRQHDYLRISLTERCNLRCLYCMPEEGVPLSPDRDLLTTPEIVLLSSVFVSQGVSKIRLTGGEPTVRRDIVPLMRRIGDLRSHGLRELCLTTNGIALHRKLEPMVEAGLTGVNLSLDTLDPNLYRIMTRRDGLEAVKRGIARILDINERGGPQVKLKINCVVMRGMNDQEIIPFVEMTRDQDIEVRFIEYMPFDGNRWSKGKMFSYEEMLDRIREVHPGLERLKGHKNDTSKTFQVPGFRGKVGFITSMTHNFCGTCNRLRITSDGNLKVCLFGDAEVSLRDLLRQSNEGEPIDEDAIERLHRIAVQQMLEARQSASETTDIDTSSMPIAIPNSQELLDLIGMAVKRKKAKHAGIGQLEHMKNRPMILIGFWRNGQSIPWKLLGPGGGTGASAPGAFWQAARRFTKTARKLDKTEKDDAPTKPRLTHVSDSGAAHMVSIAAKAVTSRVATAACTVVFSNATAARLIRENQMKKGDVLGVARVAGIMASKKTSDLIPLCHPIPISRVSVNLAVSDPSGGDREAAAAATVEVSATVECDGKTGVEMEALTAASTAALTVYDMCKAVDKGMRIEGLRVVLKDGGKSGRWVEGGREPSTVPGTE
ncbi:hypothetical protein PpBr36_00581 [Pyricularia pennisetigena]|uniref:hypothetical protein n=1 Tax=Pyricularia pennisetigena TaxID=1578925 RepID=UPI00114E5E8F|nr:hypothetical protein PpBr36_00581 [Pyricularia pennisetigena]TLS28717.1 hypothetical protein PpBr36_00581 [Pyricularia pennisetigena]